MSKGVIPVVVKRGIGLLHLNLRNAQMVAASPASKIA